MTAAPTATAAHRLSPEVLDGLATGAGGAAAIGALQRIQVSKHLLLIGHLLQHWPADAGTRVAVVDALDRARAADSERFREIVGAPLVGAWAAILSRAVHHRRADPADFGHLAAVAMVACAACGVDGSAEVPVRRGLVTLPGLGTARVAGPAATVIVDIGRITVRGNGTSIDVSTVDGPGWEAVRYLHGAATRPPGRLALDDLDPYRHGHHAPPAPRLASDEVARWQDLFDSTWAVLAEHLPQRTGELAAGLRTLVPLRTTGREARSATIRHVFGAFGLTRPQSASEFAVTLVHEFQHSKLSAVLDVEPLTHPDDEGRYFAPWRTDPRPLAGLLQGVYAFVGVADTWHALCAVDPAAPARFAEARIQVDHGLTAVEASGALTVAGAAFVAGLRRTADRLLAEPVAPAVDRAARAAFADVRRAWVDRNGPLP